MLWLCLLLVAAARAGTAQVAHLVTDLTPGGSGSLGLAGLQSFALGNRTLFLAGSGQLWITDGTAAGTQELLGCSVDCPAFSGSQASLNGVLYLTVTGDGGGPNFVWRSDGTLKGSFSLPFANTLSSPGASPTPFDLLTFGGAIYFVVYSSPDFQLWRSDGTEAGTALDPELANLYVYNIAVAGNKLLLLAFDQNAPDGTKLWLSDGTAAGTTAVPGFVSYNTVFSPFFEAIGDHAAILAPDPTGAWQIWATDATAAGTRQLTQLALPPGSPPVFPPQLTIAGNRMFFVGFTAAAGFQIWSTDLTPAGTAPITAFPGGMSEPPSAAQMAQAGSHLVFFAGANQGAPQTAWSVPIDGPAAAAVPLCPEGCGTFDPLVSLTAVGGSLVFVSGDRSGNFDLWVTDGTPAGTKLAKRGVCKDGCPAGFNLTVVDAKAYFSTAPAPQAPLALWQTNGTVAGTVRVALPAALSAAPPFGEVRGQILFDATLQPNAAPDIWVSNRTPAGTRQLTFEANAYSASPSGLVAAGNLVFFNALAPGGAVTPGGLFASDGTTATALPAPLPEQNPAPLVAAFGGVVFTVTTAGLDTQLWRSDGTVLGTRLISDLSPLLVEGGPVAANGLVYFFAFDPNAAGGGAIWRSDGSAAGTAKLFDLPGSIEQLESFSVLGQYFYLIGPTNDFNASELWRSDGTTAGTVQLTSFGGTTSATIDPALIQFGGLVYFTNGSLYQTDGTPAGTVAVQTAAAPLTEVYDLTTDGTELYFVAASVPASFYGALWRLGSDGQPRQVCTACCSGGLTPAPGGLAFGLLDDNLTPQLWWTDGTAAGTRLVSTIGTGPVAAGPSGLTAAGARIYFAVDDGVHGVELWQSDGTSAGTRLTQDIAPGPASSNPSLLTVAGNTLFFDADDGLTGTQLWALPFTGPTSCQPTSTALCLLGARFRVEVAWTDFNGNSGTGQAAALSDDTGTFWFFSASDLELVVKMLDGRALNSSFWVFYGALSNVQYAITITDTQTGLTRRYLNPSGQLASTGDVTAFGPQGASAIVLPPTGSITRRAVDASATEGAGGAPNGGGPDPAPGTNGTCTPAAGNLCLFGGRFSVQARWTDFNNNSGAGTGVSLTSDTGYFWFFDAANVETMIKVIDGRALNGKFWVFYGALSDVQYTLTVTDTTTGATKTYTNPLGQFASVADTSAF
jgi:ELWxxDGT repeat protein